MAIVAPDVHVMQVYLTEAAARVGDTSVALKVNDAGGVLMNKDQLAGYGYWTHTQYWYRIETNEPVMEIYIDWDDGEDNKGKANYSSIKFDSPQTMGVVSHIYTGNSKTGNTMGSTYGAGFYFPKIRCKSTEGYWSKYYTHGDASNQALMGSIDFLQGHTLLDNGRNDTYKIEADTSTSGNIESIPALCPSVKPPVAILKSDKKRVYAGIYNGWFRGTNGAINSTGSTVTLVGAPDGVQSDRTAALVRVTCITAGVDSTTDGGRGDIKTVDLSIGGTATIDNVTKVLKMELLNLLEDSVSYEGSGPNTGKLYPGEKLVLIYGAASGTTRKTIGEVSLGNPLLILDDPRNTITYDLTESFARTPEQSISNYYIDDGNSYTNNGYTQGAYFQVSGHTHPAFSDILNDTGGVFEASSGVVKRNYNFDINFNWTDSDYRWLPRQILARGQIKVTTPMNEGVSSGVVDRLDQQYSSLEHWRHEGTTGNYSDDVVGVAGFNWPSDMKSSALAAFKSTYDTDRWEDIESNNSKAGGSTYYLLQSGTNDNRKAFGHPSSTSLDDADNRAMLVFARDSKWSKQFFRTGCRSGDGERGRADKVLPGNTTASSNGFSGQGHMNTRVQVFYTGYESDKSSTLMWKPLKINNYTNHPEHDDTTWYTDGCFEWEEPSDWAAVSPATIPDHFYPRGDYYQSGGGTHAEKSWAYSDDTQQTAAIQEVAYIDIDGASYNQAVLNTPLKIEDKFQSVTGSGTLDLDDGLAIILEQNAANLYGKYFTFYEEQENGSEVGFYVWFRQAATQEKISIRINREGVNTINWTSLVDQPEGSGTALYGRWFSLREPDGTTHGFWMNAGTVNESGYQGPVLSPWTAGIYDGSPGADIGAHPANIHSVDISSVMNGATDADNLTAIANLIESTIDGVSGLGSATHVVDGGNTYVDFIFTDAGVAYDAAYTSQGSLRTDHSQGGKSNNVFFTYTAGRSYDGKAVATSPTPSQVDLSALTEIRVDYSDGVGQGALAQLITTEINNKVGCEVTASYDASTNNGIRVVLTNDRGGVVSNIADGTNNANVAGNGLNLQTGFTFNTSTQGVDAVPGGDFFAAGNKWNATNKKYGIMMLPKTDSGRSSTVNTYEDMIIQHTWPCSNSHSAIVDLIDPMHASLNILSITQSINFAHKGKYQTVTDRLGKSDIRKIGAMGGNIKFGGVDLNDNARAKFYSHQSKATPVYLDVKHTDGGFSRFYGVIISMSKDHPTGGVIPKFGLDMTCSHMISFDSTGSITSDGYISLGGNISEPTFV